MRIRVLLVAPSMKIVGGQSIQADRLAAAFAEHPEVDLRFRAIDPKLPMAIRRIPYIRTAVNAAVYYVVLAKGVLWSDLVHCFTSSFWGYTLWVIPAVWLAGISGRKSIVNYRDGRADQHLRDWPSAIRTLRRVNAIVVPSRYLVEVFGRFGLAAEVIPNTIDTGAFRYRERTNVQPVFLTNRGLEPLYDIPSTLRAFRMIQDRYPGSRFTVANDGPLRGELEALASDLGLKNVTFTGAVSQARMVDFYDSADIYVMSPRIDNMPGTVLECFASGLPVVSTNAGGLPYVAEHERNALLVAPADPEALAGACIRLLEEPGLAVRLAREGYRDCMDRYSVPAVRNQWASYYKKLSSRKSQEVAAF